ncbi:hypothetical protein BP6252_01904 [Coleophoma cylindrospora]|uniref:Uncharacterized protein n=1 Tax=Coleophoma cylindrospora TaxID=1849047 RepID=A0A3D8SDY9_9HELO|nr:hypothetical protein BP6252_01904 [Coleophoma cylindrospora]
MTYLRWRGPENKTIYIQHVEKGPILRTGPRELSVNCYEGGVKTIYGGGFEKNEFYARFENYGLQPMFATKESAPHAFRKRMVAQVFSKSSILTSCTVIRGTQHVLLSRLLPVVQDSAECRSPIDIVSLAYAYSMDSFTSFQFGLQNGTNLIQNVSERAWYLDSFLGPRPYLFWTTGFPRLASLLTKLGFDLAPAWLRTSMEELWAWNLRLCDRAEAMLSQETPGGIAEIHQPVVYGQMRNAMRRADAELGPEQWPRDCQSLPRQPYPRRLETATDMFDFNAAAQETSGITLTYACWELSQRPGMMMQLREELRSLSPPIMWYGHEKREGEDTAGGFPTAKALDALPLLDAVLQETLRLHAAVPGGAPRLTPAHPATTLAGYGKIPPGTRVQASAYTLHRNAEVFPDPHAWRPQRWLDSSAAELREMRKWFWAWGSGDRMCLGSHFATHSMKLALAAIYTNFRTEIVDDFGGLPQLDAFISGPESGKLIVQFHRV